MTKKIILIPIDEILADRSMCLHPKMDQEYMDNLVNSIRQYGITNPLHLDKNKQIIDGFARYDAAKELGLKEIPCWIDPRLAIEMRGQVNLGR